MMTAMTPATWILAIMLVAAAGFMIGLAIWPLDATAPRIVRVMAFSWGFAVIAIAVGMVVDTLTKTKHP